MMFKTIVIFRWTTGKPTIDSRLTALWPDLPSAAVKASAELRGCSISTLFQEMGYPAAAGLIHNYHQMRTRAHANKDELRIYDTDELPTDEDLLQHFKND